ncbi:DUF262 domain-containing protein [Ruegeria aquimaris]|uniref:DUF262 domain-containing protein n=1 Tax=Ruegeria aquimaris TaxID=2984333 RepID=A0ABT3ARI5_9RHOB|nr:DUF262 domain-containing protein [Ruegeria sp. XHP0148]MCV2891281.1 DUF262 domain-containing protein [Ruegeria sp. XHP0148]
MQDIKGYDRSVQELLSSGSYGIDYYQREYKWARKQLQELVDDLTGRFLESYKAGDTSKDVAGYGHYFLGSIVVSQADEVRYLVDGQQRMTSLTLLMIYLNNLQQGREKAVAIQNLIFADDFGEKKFKLNVPERNDCMEALFAGKTYNADDASESVTNLLDRYQDLGELFPEELQGEALPLFIYWLTRKVKLIEIIAYADEDAYTIFETMNDRGLSLTPTDMLKGYLLANIDEPAKRLEADKLIKKYLAVFAGYGEGTESDFFKAWLRSQYAKKIRERKKDAKPEDFDLIGTEYHRWVRNHAAEIGLSTGTDFHQFVMRDFRFFAGFYVRLLDASRQRTASLESVKYNADAGFTLQHHIALAAISPDDAPDTATAKAGAVADFLDCWLNLRLWNYKSNSYSSMQYSVFTLIRDVRGKGLEEVRAVLHQRLLTEQQELTFDKPVGLNQFTGKAIHRQLARFTDWLEQQAGEPGRYEDYIVRSGKNAYEIEHLWANHYDRFAEVFPQQNDFDNHRNLIGGLVLLPKKINASLNDATYAEKIKHYLKANPLAQTLNADFYEKNPGFLQTLARTGLEFVPHSDFGKDDLTKRSELYCALADHIWSPDRLSPGDTAG